MLRSPDDRRVVVLFLENENMEAIARDTFLDSPELQGISWGYVEASSRDEAGRQIRLLLADESEDVIFLMDTDIGYE